jgi:monoamine oxidase
LQDKASIQTTVAIIGGGLAGIYAAKLLRTAGLDLKLLEARDRLGGRILSVDEAGLICEDGFDLGPSWFWPNVQPRLAALVNELGLSSFPQNNDGDVIFERMSRETPGRYRATHQEPQTMRVGGGTGALVRALAAYLPDGSLHLNSCVKTMALEEKGVLLIITRLDGSEYTVAAKQVIAALPPRLLGKVSFTPAIDSTTLRHWHETATWMAPHAKFFALYDRPFWREAGLSGTAQSFVGPLFEIHDATTASGKAALLGFVGVDADRRSSMGEVSLVRACIDQLVRLYGPDARHSRATLLKDWAVDPYTATAEDRVAGGHPGASQELWVTGDWRSRLSLAGSETSQVEPGYLAGAVSAAERAVSEIVERLEGKS